MASASTSGDGAKEYTVRVPKTGSKNYSILKFNPANNVDFTKCEGAKMERENNLKQYKVANDIDVMPQFGAGSEFGREQREEARRKKYGISKKKYSPHDQPWLLKLGTNKSARKFKGIREGGVTENASYFVFKQSADGAFEAFPLDEWYNFTPVAKYKSLNAEEAEEEFIRRDKTLNYFSIMVKKRLNKEDEEPTEDGEPKASKSKGKKNKGFLLTDLDEWAMLTDSDEDAGSGPEISDSEKPVKKKQGKNKVRKLAKRKGSDAEAEEESDDVDEGREVDYMTDTDSEDDDMYAEHVKTDKYEEKGVEDADGLRKIIESDEEEDEENDKDDEEEEDQEQEEEKKKGSDSDSSSSDSDTDPEKDSKFNSALFMLKKEKKKKSGSKESSRCNTPTIDSDKKNQKRKQDESDAATVAKKPRSVSPVPAVVNTTAPAPTATEGITEDTVRRYLMRKPMTTKDLLQKFRSKNPNISKDKLVTSIGLILKKLNPEKTKVKDKLFLFIKKT